MHLAMHSGLAWRGKMSAENLTIQRKVLVSRFKKTRSVMHLLGSKIGVRIIIRYYDPVAGRFFSTDPIDFTNGGNFNRYGYAKDNPFKYIDPDGRQDDDIQRVTVTGKRPDPFSSPVPSGFIDLIKQIFPSTKNVPVVPKEVPKVDDACVQNYLKANYPEGASSVINFGNLQQFYPSNNSNAVAEILNTAHLGAEKIIVTQTPGAVGQRVVNAIPARLAVGNVVGRGLITTSAALSGAAELAGAAVTPFSTFAMAMARSACTK